MKRLNLVSVMVLGLLGCDSPGGGGRTAIAPDVTRDATSDANGDALFPQPDTTATASDSSATTTPNDTSVPVDTAVTTPDTTVVPDTIAPDTTASVCEQGCLDTVATPGALVTFIQRASTTAPPTLGGGGQPSGEYQLTVVDIYPYGTFVDGVTMTLTNQGDTRGVIEFDGDAMQLAFHLDLHIAVDVFGSTGEDTAQADLAAGGCYEASQAFISGDFGACAVGWEGGTVPPTAVGYALGSNLRIALELPPEVLIAMLPPELQGGGELVIVGPLTIIASLEPK